MTIGTGIAILGVWMFPVACAISRQATGTALFLSIAVSSAVTILAILN